MRREVSFTFNEEEVKLMLASQLGCPPEKIAKWWQTDAAGGSGGQFIKVRWVVEIDEDERGES